MLGSFVESGTHGLISDNLAELCLGKSKARTLKDATSIPVGVGVRSVGISCKAEPVAKHPNNILVNAFSGKSKGRLVREESKVIGKCGSIN